MSGGEFNYLQRRYEWNEMIEKIEDNIKGNCYDKKTITELKKGLKAIKKARIYIERIDLLLSVDDGEESFKIRLLEDLSKKD